MATEMGANPVASVTCWSAMRVLPMDSRTAFECRLRVSNTALKTYGG